MHLSSRQLYVCAQVPHLLVSKLTKGRLWELIVSLMSLPRARDRQRGLRGVMSCAYETEVWSALK